MNSTHPYYMPALNALIAAQGTRVSNFLVSTGVCCPARASVLTGKLAHCTNVTGNSFPAGGVGMCVREKGWGVGRRSHGTNGQ